MSNVVATNGNSDNSDDWNRRKITQTKPEQHIGKHEIKGTQKTAILATAHTYCGKC